jgi:hypothetical protein
MSAPEQGAIVLGHRSDDRSTNLHLALIGRVNATDEIQQGGLARTAATSQRNAFAAIDFKVQVIQNPVQPVAFLIAAA